MCKPLLVKAGSHTAVPQGCAETREGPLFCHFPQKCLCTLTRSSPQKQTLRTEVEVGNCSFPFHRKSHVFCGFCVVPSPPVTGRAGASNPGTLSVARLNKQTSREQAALCPPARWDLNNVENKILLSKKAFCF